MGHTGRIVEIEGLEPSTYGLQSRRSSQLSYNPVQGWKDSNLQLTDLESAVLPIRTTPLSFEPLEGIEPPILSEPWVLQTPTLPLGYSGIISKANRLFFCFLRRILLSSFFLVCKDFEMNF